MSDVPLATQIASAKRELRMRKSVYPGWTRSGRMTQADADHEIACMTAIVETLEQLGGVEKTGDLDL